MPTISTFVVLLTAAVICPQEIRGVSVFKNDSETLQMKLNRPMPDLAPFEENERIKPLSGLEYTHRVFMKQLFSKAFYSFCNRKITVKPIYFWPGDRVDLPCEMCDRHDAFNGRIKYWSFVRQRFFGHFHKLGDLSKERWTVLDEPATRLFRLPNERVVFMPVHDAKKKRTRLRTDRSDTRPNMTFVQRDGRLKILNAETNAYGLYRCFDDSDRERVEIVYYLIPIIPLFIIKMAHVYEYECLMATRRPDDQRYIERFDSQHRFHVVTPTMFDAVHVERNFVPDHWRGQDYASVGFMPPQTGVVYTLPLIVSKQVEIDLNLQVFVHWSPWSACRRHYRTRRGYCHIGKVKKNKAFVLNDLQRKILMARDLEMFIILHRLFDTVVEFNRHGIPLFRYIRYGVLKMETASKDYPFFLIDRGRFSGVMYHLITDRDEQWPVAQCTNFLYDSFQKRTVPDRVKLFHDYIVDPIKDGAYNIKAVERHGYLITRIYETACFYLNETDIPTTVLYGFAVNQNERC